MKATPEMIAAFWRQKNTGTQELGQTGPDTDDYSAFRAMMKAARSQPCQCGELLAEINALLDLHRKGALVPPVPALAIELLERALRPAQAAEGWVMVPRYPTIEMKRAGAPIAGDSHDLAHECWSRMIAAATAPRPGESK